MVDLGVQNDILLRSLDYLSFELIFAFIEPNCCYNYSLFTFDWFLMII